MRNALFLSLLLIFVLSGCETLRGFGRDMQKAGSWMERQVSEAQK